MCWNIFSEKDKEKRIAESDIICYKVLKQNYRSLFEDFKYKFRILYKLDIELKPTEDFKIYEGFHSYKDPPIKSYMCSIVDDPLCVECTIPKGSTYYINRLGEIVSDSIIINKKLE